MKSAELVRQHAILRSLIKRAGHETSTKDIEMLGHWARYACVLVAGFVENAVHIVYSSYIRETASPQTARYAVNQIEDIQNPKAKRLVEIAASFDAKWAAELDAYLDDNFRREAINSIMTNRHQIAHGGNSSIGLGSVEQYLARIVEVIELMEKQCNI